MLAGRRTCAEERLVAFDRLVAAERAALCGRGWVCGVRRRRREGAVAPVFGQGMVGYSRGNRVRLVLHGTM